MPRQPNDGRGRIGGRKKGTPNKPKPFKEILSNHSMQYFSADPETGLSSFEKDLKALKPSERVEAEIKILSYHTPKIQAIAAVVQSSQTDLDLAAHLASLCNTD